MWLEHGIDIASHAGSVLGHGGAAHDEYIGEDTPADKALAKRGEGSLDLRRAKQNVIPVWSRGLQVPGRQVNAVLAECCRCPDQRIGPLDFQFRGEPRPLKRAYLGPLRRGQIVLGSGDPRIADLEGALPWCDPR